MGGKRGSGMVGPFDSHDVIDTALSKVEDV